MTLKKLLPLLLIFFVLLGCDPMAPQPTPGVIIITNVPTRTPVPTPTVPTATPTIAPTRTPFVTATPTLFPCAEEGGQVIRFDRNASQVVDENLRYRVYIPPCYVESQKRYPYVILLHGQASTESQWEDLGAVATLDQGIRLGALPPMILVMPFWGVVGNENAFPPDPSYETVVLDELLPSIQRDFCTWNDREHRAIGGISRGGFWAFSIGLRHPDVFGIIGGHSAVFPDDPQVVPPAFSPLDMARDSALLPDADLRIYMDNGASDLAGESQQLLSSRLAARGITHTYIINTIGGHDNDYWSAHVSEYLAFYGRDWPRNAAELPSCLEPSP
ncbi:MAG: alpha/beta hydrolase-fold protein [Anaerolineae bacterium]